MEEPQMDWEKESEENFKKAFPGFGELIAAKWPYAVWVIAIAEVVECVLMVVL